MSSESHIPVAKDLSPDAQLPPTARPSGIFEREPRDIPEPSISRDTARLAREGFASPRLWHAAVEGDQRGTPDSLARIWVDVVRGNLRVWWESVGSDRVILVTRFSRLGRPVCTESASILARILSGEQQKVVACELGLAASTVSGQYARGLAKLDCLPTSVPLALVLAAQTASGIGRIPARSCAFDHEGARCFVVSVRRPAIDRLTELTRAERAIAQWIIEGYPRFEIASRRATSIHTVSRQIHSVFTRLNASGRFSLIRRAAERGAFE